MLVYLGCPMLVYLGCPTLVYLGCQGYSIGVGKVGPLRLARSTARFTFLTLAALKMRPADQTPGSILASDKNQDPHWLPATGRSGGEDGEARNRNTIVLGRPGTPERLTG